MHKVLEGELGRFRLADLLLFLAHSGLTAVLVLERRGQENKVFFRNGRPVFAVSTRHELRLGRLLVRLGKLSDADVDDALVKRRAGGWRLGQVFLSDNVISEHELAAALKVQISETIYDSFGWSDGGFSVFDDVPPPATAVTLDADTHALILEGVRRHEAPARTAALAAALERVPDALLNPERVKRTLALTREEWQVFFLVDGRRSVRDICRLVGPGDPHATLLLLQRLVDARLVSVAAEPGASTVPTPVLEGEGDDTHLAPGEAAREPVEVEFATGTRGRPPQDDTRHVVDAQAVPYLADAQRLTISRLVLERDGAECAFPLIRDAYTLGRHRNNDIVIADPKISSFHARIDRTAEGFVIVDLQSRNGTFVNGSRVTSSALQTGDEVRLGTARLLYKVDYTSAR